MHVIMKFILEVRKMVFSNNLFYLSILPVLSAATIWQNSTECAQAVAEFSRERTCFGSLAEWNAWQQSILNNGRFTIHLDLLHSPGLTEGLISSYNSFCTSQTCVDFYANVVVKCLKRAHEQFNLDLALLVDQVVNHSCSTNERGQYCATVQLEKDNTDFQTVVACAANLTATDPRFMDLSCNSTCISLPRVGCCVNNYLDTLGTILRETVGRYADNNGIWSNCGVTDPGTCPTMLSNPLRNSGHHTVYSHLRLLAAVLVSVMVILMDVVF